MKVSPGGAAEQASSASTVVESETDSIGSDTDADNYDYLEAIEACIKGNVSLNFRVPWSATKGRIASRRSATAEDAEAPSEERTPNSTKRRVFQTSAAFGVH